MPPLRGRSRAHFPRSRLRAAVERLPDREDLRASPRSTIRCDSRSAIDAGWCRPRTTRRPTSCSATTTPISPALLASWLAHAASLRGRHDASGWTSAGTASSSRSPPTTAICCKNFVAAGIPCFGIEPTASTADAAEKLGIPVMREFFGDATWAGSLPRRAGRPTSSRPTTSTPTCPTSTTSPRGLNAAAQARRNGHARISAPDAPARAQPVRHRLSRALFLSVAVSRSSASSSQPACACSTSKNCRPTAAACACMGAMPTMRGQARRAVAALLAEEARRGLQAARDLSGLSSQGRTRQGRSSWPSCSSKSAPARPSPAYGAAAKGNTLLNYAGVKPDLLPFVCDAAAAKQGKFMPGSHIPIVGAAACSSTAPTT